MVTGRASWSRLPVTATADRSKWHDARHKRLPQIGVTDLMDLLSRVHPAVDLGAPNRVMTARRLTAAPSHAATRMLPNLVGVKIPVVVRSHVAAALIAV